MEEEVEDTGPQEAISGGTEGDTRIEGIDDHDVDEVSENDHLNLICENILTFV